MGSLRKNYDSQKLLGQVYTPAFVVQKMLDDMGYCNASILGKRVIDPACGDGRFLVEIVQRIIQYSPRQDLAYNLSFVYGWDIDTEAIELCKTNLNALVADYQLTIHWNIVKIDSLAQLHVTTTQFDFIVGNPPYIRIQHLPPATRAFIQANYSFCKTGATDIYIAFFELAYALLAPMGICAFVTPNSYFYTQTGRFVRAFLADKKALLQISNYADIQLFERASTYSAITIFNKLDKTHFLYELATDKTVFSRRKIPFLELENTTSWQLSTSQAIDKQTTKLKAICKIHVGLTTLCDKVYMVKLQHHIDAIYALVKTRMGQLITIERAILRPIIKVSKFKTNSDTIDEYVIFPYQRNNTKKYQIIPEETMQLAYPSAYNYLLEHRELLDKRDNGKPNAVAWYAFGRNQGLETSFGKKILFSPMNKQPNFMLFEQADCTFYSGYCIKYDGDYNWLLEQLNSTRLANFVAVSSRDFRGGYKAYNKRVLEEFTLDTATVPTSEYMA